MAPRIEEQPLSKPWVGACSVKQKISTTVNSES